MDNSDTNTTPNIESIYINDIMSTDIISNDDLSFCTTNDLTINKCTNDRNYNAILELNTIAEKLHNLFKYIQSNDSNKKCQIHTNDMLTNEINFINILLNNIKTELYNEEISNYINNKLICDINNSQFYSRKCECINSINTGNINIFCDIDEYDEYDECNNYDEDNNKENINIEENDEDMLIYLLANIQKFKYTDEEMMFDLLANEIKLKKTYANKIKID